MKSSQTKTTPSSGSTTARNREESSIGAVKQEQQQEEFSNVQEQGEYNPAAENFSSYETTAGNQPAYEQQGGNYKRTRSQSFLPDDVLAQTGVNSLMDAWSGLVLGQVQIATQAAIRLTQCCFSPSLISSISEVQRRYAEDSISSVTNAASKLAQFTPRALNQNLQQFNQQRQQRQQYQQPQQQQYS